jgi:Tfp pilus assembly protein PilN
MTEVNLLPPEFRRRHKSRAQTRQVVMGVLVVILLLVVLFMYEGSRLSSAKQDLASQNAKNAALQTQIGTLQRFADLQSELTTKKQLVSDLEQAQVQWSGVLHDLSMVMPSDVYLTSLTGAITLGPGGWETLPGPTGLIGNVQFQGSSFDYPNVALWLDRMVNVDGWDNAWVSSAASASSDEQSGGSTGVIFNGTVDLTPQSALDGIAP